jgi:hypothetical protein
MTNGRSRRAPEEKHTSSVTDALALYDTAGRIDRLKVTLEVKPVPENGKVPITVFEQIGVLGGIIGDVSTEIGPAPAHRSAAPVADRRKDRRGIQPRS